MSRVWAAASLALASAMPASPVLAQQCLLGTAVYGQEGGYVLRFRPTQELHGGSAASNVFWIDVPGREEPLVAWVRWNNGESRPTGAAMLNCPEDAFTEEDFADCTYWRGVMYALGDKDAALLPGEDEPAPQAILLSDFGRQIRYSLVNDIGSETVPWDVFRLERCD